MSVASTPERSTPSRRGRWIASIVAGIALVYGGVVGVLVLQAKPDASPGQESAVLLAVGNLGGPDSSDAKGVARLLSEYRMDALVLLGDLAGPNASAGAWTGRYQPLFGDFARQVKPTPGEMDYAADGGAAYFDYFSTNVGDFAASPYYAFSLSGWRIYSLDSEGDGKDPGGEMYEWLRNDLRSTDQGCVAAFWHDPVETVGPSEPDSAGMSLIYGLLAGNGADLVLSAHDQNYQRWKPVDGVTSFVVGTGGQGLSAPTRTDDRLAVTRAGAAGVLQLELRQGRADYRYISTDGTVLDTGSLTCHGRPTADLPRPTTPTGLVAKPGAAGEQLSWRPVAGDPAAIGYLVYRGSDVIGFTTEPSYEDSSLPPGASVLYSVRAVALSGARSVPSDSAHSGGDAPGFTDYQYTALEANPASPTADKPQSKLWWLDGSWWGILWGPDPARPTHSGYYIQRFDASKQAWVNTGVEMDERDRSRADVLWDEDSQNLYAVSTIASGAIKLYRYSYAGGTYTPDSGFPIRLTENGSESASIAKDSAGVLWVTMTQPPDGSGPCGAGQPCVVRMMHSTDAEYRWSDPATMPFDEATVEPDDLSTVAAFGGDRVALAWSNQADSHFYVAIHRDGTPDTAWSLEPLEVAPRGSDDHLNMKADSSGRLYLLGKTSLNDPANASPSNPLMILFLREADGTWRSSTIWTVGDDVTRPALVVDEHAGQVYAVAAQPGTGGAIYVKRASIVDLDFGPGLGTVLMAGGTMNNPTVTKQTVDLRNGILVLAADSGSRTYWHNLITTDTVIELGP
jgi:hypothetical protein